MQGLRADKCLLQQDSASELEFQSCTVFHCSFNICRYLHSRISRNLIPFHTAMNTTLLTFVPYYITHLHCQLSSQGHNCICSSQVMSLHIVVVSNIEGPHAHSVRQLSDCSYDIPYLLRKCFAHAVLTFHVFRRRSYHLAVLHPIASEYT